MEKLVCSEFTGCQPASLLKKLFHIYFLGTLLSFFRTHYDDFFRRGFETMQTTFFLSENLWTSNRLKTILTASWLFSQVYYYPRVEYGTWRCLECGFFSLRKTRKKKNTRISSFLLSSYVLWCIFYKKLFIVALHHGENFVLSYFYICIIKYTLSAMISTMKKC